MSINITRAFIKTPGLSLMDSVRIHRNMLLADCDWVLLSDSSLSEEKKAEFISYRQALRDLPQVQSSIQDESEIIWPAKPNL